MMMMMMIADRGRAQKVISRNILIPTAAKIPSCVSHAHACTDTEAACLLRVVGIGKSMQKDRVEPFSVGCSRNRVDAGVLIIIVLLFHDAYRHVLMPLENQGPFLRPSS